MEQSKTEQEKMKLARELTFGALERIRHYFHEQALKYPEHSKKRQLNMLKEETYAELIKTKKEMRRK